MTEPALSVENIEVVYHHSVQVLRGLSLAVPAGQIVALLGSNGAGKTTILKTISGIIDPRKGSIEFKGQDITIQELTPDSSERTVGAVRTAVPRSVGRTRRHCCRAARGSPGGHRGEVR